MAGPWVRGSQAQVRGGTPAWEAGVGACGMVRDAVDMHEVHVHTQPQGPAPLLRYQTGGKTSTTGQNGLGRAAGLQLDLGAAGETEAQCRHGPVQGTWPVDPATPNTWRADPAPGPLGGPCLAWV